MVGQEGADVWEGLGTWPGQPNALWCHEAGMRLCWEAQKASQGHDQGHQHQRPGAVRAARCLQQVGAELCEGPTTAEDPEEVDHDVFSQRGSFLWSCIPGYMPALDQDRPWLQMLQTWRKTTGKLEAAGQWWLVIAHVLLLFIALPLVLLWMRNSRHENPGCLLATSSD